MRDKHRRDVRVVVDDLSLGKTASGIQDFVQIGQLQLPALNFNDWCSAHAASLGFDPFTLSISLGARRLVYDHRLV